MPLAEKSIRVLLADDSTEFVTALGRHLQDAFPQLHVVGVARTGEQALTLAGECRPHLAIMDIRMPGMGGIEAARQLKARADAPRILVLSAHDEEGYRQAAMAAGADAFVSKHDLFRELPRVLAQLVESGGELAPAQATEWMQQILRSAGSLPGMLALGAVLLGDMALAGWMLDAPALRSLVPGLVAMKQDAALCFVAAGGAAWLLQHSADAAPAGPAGQWYRGIALGLAGVVLLVAGLTAGEYLSWWRAGFDPSLFNADARASVILPSGPMYPAAAASFLLIASALIFAAAEKYTPVRVVSVTVLAIGTTSLLGYFYGVPALHGAGSVLSQPLNTSAGFVLLALSLLLPAEFRDRPGGLFSTGVGGVVVRRFLPGAVLGPALLGWAALAGRRQGIYGDEFALVLFAVSLMAMLVALLLQMAASLDAQERERLQIHARETLLARALEQTDDAVTIADSNGVMQFANAAFERMSGWSRAETLGCTVPLNRSDTVDDAYRDRLWGTLLSGRTFRDTMLHRRRNGAAYYEDKTITPLRDERGNLSLFLCTARDVTERITAERVIKESEHRLNALLQNLPGAVFRYPVQRDTVAEFLSDGIVALTGYPAADFTGRQRNFGDLVHADDRERVRTATHAALHARRPYRVQYRLTAADGASKWVEERGIGYYNDDGTPEGLEGIVLDITEQKRAEESVQLFRSLLDRNPDAIQIIDPGTARFLDVNDTWCRELGYTRAEGMSLTIMDIDPGVDAARWAQNTASLECDGTVLVEATHRRKDGTTYPVEVGASWIQLERDYIVAISRDISRRKRAEQDLAESRRRLETLVATLPGVAYRARNDRRWTTEFISASVINMTGIPAADFMQDRRSWAELIHPEDRERVWAETQAALRDKRQFELIYRLRIPTGAEPWILEQGCGVFDATGALQFLEGYLADISQQKQAQIQLQRLNRVYGMLSDINNLIVHVRDRKALFDGVSRIAVETGHFGLVWVGLINEDRTVLKPTAQHGFDTGVIGETEVPLVPGAGSADWSPALRAISENRAIVDNDIAARPDLNPVRTAAVAAGFGSLVVLPLGSGDRTFGVLVLYARERGFFDQQELELLNELSADIGFSLDHMEQEARLEFTAFHDPLTGLANRAGLNQRLEAALAAATAKSGSCALLLVDINNFHEINNSLGQENGDLLLRQVADRIGSALWGSDAVACLGGDEFAILLSRLADSGDVDVVIAKITTALRGEFDVAGVPVTLEARMGSAVYPEQAGNASLLWQRAAIALHAAKTLSRTHIVYDRSIDGYEPKQLALLSELRKAIDGNELVLHYQPKIDLRTRRTTGVEALVRWQHPQRGLLYPDAFIWLAEKTSLISGLTTWVLANGMRQGRTWDRNGVKLDLSMNVSARNLHDPDFATEILDLARSSRFPVRRLTLEVTESAIMADPERAKAILDELHRAGVCIAMDDFGIGHSSLAYLKDLPINRIKIDKTFVIGFREPHNASIIRAAIKMTQSLGMRVTAEGVEDAEALAFLRKAGCDLGQGYYFSKPLPADRLAEWLRESPWKLEPH